MHQTDIILDSNLSPVQVKVIAAILGGATVQAAATAAGVHRNTIAYWRRTSPFFRDALRNAHYDKALSIREETGNQVAGAFAAIHAILNNPGTSDSARLNAAKYIIDKASTPPPPQPVETYSIEHVPTEILPDPAPGPATEVSASASPAARPEIVHRNAQTYCQLLILPDSPVQSEGIGQRPEI
jgi:hypothetical protein